MKLPTLAATHAAAIGAAVVLLAAVPIEGTEVGSALPTPNLADFAQSSATSFSDYFGQAVMLEFFAYW